MLKWLDRCLRAIIIVLFSLVVIITLVQVISRHLSIPLQGTDETVRFLFIWLVFIGIAYGMKEKVHIAVDFLNDKFSTGVQFVINILIYLLMIFYAVVLIYFGIEVTKVMHLQFAPISRIPMSYIFAAIPVGSTLLLLYILIDLKNLLKERRG